ncbi:MFS transporter [Nonomuraea sp. NEAU-A123]|nr:MFS transporter [Nonomuraea sp. NEAU-A123]
MPYAGFTVFGLFWGVWGASVPAIRHQAGLTAGQLGTALLFIAAGALPAMLVAGRAVDRWGQRVMTITLVLLGIAGVAVAITARDLPTLSVGLTVLGASSGAADVAINAAAGAAERATGRPVIIRAHGFFSLAVVVASLATGLLNAGGIPAVVPFVLVALAAAVSAAIATGDQVGPDSRRSVQVGPDSRRSVQVGPDSRRSVQVGPDSRRSDRAGPDSRRRDHAGAPEARSGSALRAHLSLLIVAGGLGALAFAVENAHQSWSAVYLADALHAEGAVVGAGPAVFAGFVALTRFAIGTRNTHRAWIVLAAGAMIAAAGTLLLALAASVALALLGLALAAAGTAVLFPTVLGLATAGVTAAARGTATSVVSTVAYLGYLAGPVYVGYWAQKAGLPGAMMAVAALAAGLALLAWPALRAVAPSPERLSTAEVAYRGTVSSEGGGGQGVG